MEMFKIRAILAFPVATSIFCIALNLQTLDHPPQECGGGFASLFDWIDVNFFAEERLAHWAWRNTSWYALCLCLAVQGSAEPFLQAIAAKQMRALRELGTTIDNIMAKLADELVDEALFHDELIRRNFRGGGVHYTVHVDSKQSMT
jgi:hypothetical protein